MKSVRDVLNNKPSSPLNQLHVGSEKRNAVNGSVAVTMATQIVASGCLMRKRWRGGDERRIHGRNRNVLCG